MNIYLIACESYKLLDNEINSLVKKDNIVIKYDLRNDTLNDVINEANYYSLTGDKKIITIKCSDWFKSQNDENDINDDIINTLNNYFEHVNPDVTLIFTSFNLPDKRKKLYKLFSKKGIVSIIPTLNKKELVYECMNLLKANGYIIDYDTGNYIVQNSYSNYDIMINEISKIYSLLPKKRIGISDIKDIISVSLNDNIFNFINSIIERDLKGAINNSKNFEILKIDPSIVLIMLYKEFLIYYHLNNKVSPKEVQAMYKKEDWQMQKYMLNKDNFSLKELKKIIIKLNDYDYKYKTGKIDKTVILNLLAFDLCS